MTDKVILLGGNVLGGRGGGGTATTATNLAGGAANDVPYQTGAGATAFASGFTVSGGAFATGVLTTSLTTPLLKAGATGGTIALSTTAGMGPVFAGGTTADNTGRAATFTHTWTNGTTANIGILSNTTLGTATGKLLDLQVGGVSKFSVVQDGAVTSNGLVSATYFNSTVGTFAGQSNSGTGLILGTSFDVNASRVSAGVMGIGTGAAGSTAGSLSLTNLTASGNVAVATQSPASGAAGTAGTITWDASFIYVCTASGVWKRVAITGGY